MTERLPLNFNDWSTADTFKVKHDRIAGSIVWVPHRVKEDLRAAEALGSLVFINQRYVYTDEITETQTLPRSFHWHMTQAAELFLPSRDYLMLVGDYSQQAQMVSLLTRRNVSFRALRWDREAAGYATILIGV